MKIQPSGTSWCTAMAFVLAVTRLVISTQAADNDACAQALESLWKGSLGDTEAVFAQCTKLSEVEDAVNHMKRRLGDISTKLNQVKYSKQSTAPIEPAMQWAQSPDTIFINVKFAHKLDAPACIDVIDPTIEMEESRVGIRAGCKGVDKHFKLDLTLFSSIAVANSSWSMTSVGRGSFTLSKQIAAKWDRLLATREKPKNLHVWWAMQEKYDAALDSLNDAPTNVPSSTVEQLKAGLTPPKEEEDSLSKGHKAAKKRVQDQAKKAKREVEERATKEKAKIQKQLDAIEDEESKHIADLDNKLKASLTKLDEKLQQLKAKRHSGEVSVEWTDDEHDKDNKPSEGSFLAAAAKVLKRAFGVDKEGLKDMNTKDEV